MIGTFILVAAVTAKPFTIVEASIPDMQAALRSGRVTSRELVQQSLDRIATYEDKLHAAITINPNALSEADQLDAERKAGKIRIPRSRNMPISVRSTKLRPICREGGRCRERQAQPQNRE